MDEMLQAAAVLCMGRRSPPTRSSQDPDTATGTELAWDLDVAERHLESDRFSDRLPDP